jgi:FHA domain
MSDSPSSDERPTSWREWARVQVHPGTGVVDRSGDTLLVVPALPRSTADSVRELLDLCRRPYPTAEARFAELRALIELRPPAQTPDFVLLVRAGRSVRALVHGPVLVLVDGRPPGQPAAEHVLDDAAWQDLTIGGTGQPPEVGAALRLDLRDGTVQGGGATVHRVAAVAAPAPSAAETPAVPATPSSSTQLRPIVRFRTVPLGECALRSRGRQAAGRRPPLPIAGTPDEVATARETGAEVLVEGVICPQGHFTDPEESACRTCGTALPGDARRLRRPRPPLGVLVTDGGTIYTVTGDFVIGRETEGAPDVLAGRARPLPLRDAARSTSRVHARVTISGWTVLLSDNGSANGTFLSRHGAAGPWLPVPPQSPVRLLHGDRIRLGRRQLLFDTWRESVVPQVFR